LLDVGLGEPEHAHVLERGADTRSPESDVTQDRDDAREKEAAEHDLELGMFHDFDDLVDGQPESGPDLFSEEPVAHAVTGVDAELLAFVALGLGQLRIEVAQREAAEHHVTASSCMTYALIERASGSVALLRIRLKAASARPSMSTCIARLGHVPATVR